MKNAVYAYFMTRCVHDTYDICVGEWRRKKDN